MELQLTTRRWTIRIARTKPAAGKPSAPSAAPYPMRTAGGRLGPTPTARPKDVR